MELSCGSFVRNMSSKENDQSLTSRGSSNSSQGIRRKREKASGMYRAIREQKNGTGKKKEGVSSSELGLLFRLNEYG